VRVRAREAADLQAVERFLSGRDSLRVARLGRLERTLDHPALVAEGEGGEMAGVLTYVPGEAEAEILTLHAARQWGGAGAVDRARTQLKPEIPPEGEYGIPLRDELVLEKAI
jgi:hypothetical protein